jgi:hypothetical protein
MNSNVLAIVAIIAIPFVIYLVYRLVQGSRKTRADKRMVENLPLDGVPSHWAFSETTPNGIRVIWNENPFNSEEDKAYAFACFDIGATNCFNAMRDKFPTWDFNNQLLTIGILPPTRKNIDGSAALHLRHAQAGDNIAGIVIGVDDGYAQQMILIPSQKENGWNYPQQQCDIIWFEREHDMEGKSDRMVFLRYSGRVPDMPDIHPHHPMPAERQIIPAPAPRMAAKGFVRELPVEARCCGV